MKFIVTGAYGRAYVTEEAMKADYRKGKDFAIAATHPPVPTGTYMSKRDVEFCDTVEGKLNNNGVYVTLYENILGKL